MGRSPDWRGVGDQSLVCVFGAPHGGERLPGNNAIRGAARHVMLMLNPSSNSREFVVPEFVRGIKWRKFIDTAAAPPKDVYPDFDGPETPFRGPILLPERSLVCYVASA
jgi:isoamylase